jgi:hypothetical protein
VRLQSDAIGSHVWDASVVDNLACAVIDPTTSSLRPSRDYAGGRTGEQVLLQAVRDAVQGLVAERGSDPAGWRDQHPRRPIRSLSGVIGPSLTMPYQDRGSWVHVVAFDGPGGAAAPVAGPVAAPARTAPAGPRRLAATGPAALAAWGALAVLAGGLGLRRRSPRRVTDLDGIEDDDLAG